MAHTHILLLGNGLGLEKWTQIYMSSSLFMFLLNFIKKNHIKVELYFLFEYKFILLLLT